MEKEYKKIDVLKYVSEGVKRGELTFAEAKKFKRIYATVGTLGQVVPTILSDGTIETERVVSLDPKTGKPGWVVKNISSPEQWIISDSTFQKKYEADPEQEGVYRPKGKNMLAAQISEDIEFAPPMWGGDIQRINAGGYLLIDPTNPTDIYGIGEKEFNDTYKFIQEEQKTKTIKL